MSSNNLIALAEKQQQKPAPQATVKAPSPAPIKASPPATKHAEKPGLVKPVLQVDVKTQDKKEEHKKLQDPKAKEEHKKPDPKAKEDSTSPGLKKGVTNNLTKKADELMDGDRKKTDIKEPEKIQMRIQVLDKEVNFVYNLKKDTAEVVAKEFVSEMKFDTKD